MPIDRTRSISDLLQFNVLIVNLKSIQLFQMPHRNQTKFQVTLIYTYIWYIHGSTGFRRARVYARDDDENQRTRVPTIFPKRLRAPGGGGERGN